MGEFRVTVFVQMAADSEEEAKSGVARLMGWSKYLDPAHDYEVVAAEPNDPVPPRPRPKTRFDGGEYNAVFNAIFDNGPPASMPNAILCEACLQWFEDEDGQCPAMDPLVALGGHPITHERPEAGR